MDHDLLLTIILEDQVSNLDEKVGQGVPTNFRFNSKYNSATLLIQAVIGRCEFIFRYLISDDRVRLDAADDAGRTALSHAAEIGHEEFVVELLSKRVDLDYIDQSGQTPLMHAARCGHLSVNP